MEHLTILEKKKELRYLREKYKKATLTPDGHLDLELIPYLERINACKDIMTLQSCTGHKKSAKRNYTFGGHLWLRLSKEKMMAFNEKVVILVKSKCINRVDIMYSHYKEIKIQKIICIAYQGHESDMFYQSIEFITRFFESLK